MVNRKVCLVLLSLVILILFIVSIYLMTLVDPDPVVSRATTAPDPDPVNNRRRQKGKKPKDAYDVVFPQPEGKLSYGLPKASDTTTLKEGAVDEIVSLYRHLAAEGLLVNSSEVQDVFSPMKIPTNENQNTTVSERINSSPIKIPTSENQNTTVSERINSSTVQMTTPSVKGVRRSVNDIHQASRILEPSSSVILKIIDDLGHPRLEIKLEPKRVEEKRTYYRRFANNTSNIHPESENMEEFDGEKETLIKILNNNTLIINDPGEFQNTNESDIINLKNRMFGKNRTKVNNYKEITLMISNAEHKNDTTGGASGSLWNNTKLLYFNKLLDNTTKTNDLSVNSTSITTFTTNITINRSNETNPSLVVMNENGSVFKHDMKNLEDELIITNSSSIKNITESPQSSTLTAKTDISVV